MNKISVPFRIKDVLAGFAEAEGILSLVDDMVHLEFQTVDGILGILKSGVKNIDIPVNKIEEIDFKKSLFGTTLTIQFSSINDASDIPGQQSGEVKISIAKKHTEAALDFVSGVNLEVADHRLREAESRP